MSDGENLLTRSIVSIFACALITWQLQLTSSFGGAERWTWRCIRIGGTRLQWYLLALMALSVAEGVLAVVTDVLLLRHAGGVASAAVVKEEIQLSLTVAHLSELVLSLTIIGLGVNAWVNGAKYARVAIALGVASLTIRRLPAPLVLVLGVTVLHRTRARTAGAGADDGCCSLSCALRPLLILALLESMYASIVVTDDLVERLDRVAHDPALVRSLSGSDEEARLTLTVLNEIRPDQMIDMAAQQLGQLVQFGVLIALGFSGRAHGLKHALVPVAAAFIPGLPVSFGIVFYFLLETRQAQGSSTLLPLAAVGDTSLGG